MTNTNIDGSFNLKRRSLLNKTMLELNKIHRLDALEGLKQLPDESVDCVVTSPPYWNLRDYGIDGQIGLEETFEEYLDKLVRVFDEAKRVLRRDGTCWINIGDTYGGASSKVAYRNRARGKSALMAFRDSGLPARGHVRGRWDKCLLGVPERFMLRMLERGWILRNKIAWHKPNALPSSVSDRFTSTWEYMFLFVKSRKYYFDLDAVREPHKRDIAQPDRDNVVSDDGEADDKQASRDGQLAVLDEEPRGKNPGDCWSVSKRPFPQAHYAVFPEQLIERPILTTPTSICVKCGKPRRRVTRTERSSAVNNISPTALEAKQNGRGIAQPLTRYEARHFTIGWTECDCHSGFRPAVILDPFIGSGTTAIVAKKLGRDFIGYDLNPDYVALANTRLARFEAAPTKEAA